MFELFFEVNGATKFPIILAFKKWHFDLNWNTKKIGEATALHHAKVEKKEIGHTNAF